MATARRTAKLMMMATAQRSTSTTTMTMVTVRRDTTTTAMATDVNDDDDDEADDASSTGCDEGDNCNRDDGKDACTLAMATTQPVVRRRCVKRRRPCKEMRCNNQLVQTKRRGRGWTRAAAARQKVTRGEGTYGKVDNDGDGTTGDVDDNNDHGDGATGYDNDDDGDRCQRQRQQGR